jgi:hypothetical protein
MALESKPALKIMKFPAPARIIAGTWSQKLLRDYGYITHGFDEVLAPSLALLAFACAAKKPRAKHQIVRCRVCDHVRFDQTRPRRIISGVVKLNEIPRGDCGAKNELAHNLCYLDGQARYLRLGFRLGTLYDSRKIWWRGINERSEFRLNWAVALLKKPNVGRQKLSENLGLQP